MDKLEDEIIPDLIDSSGDDENNKDNDSKGADKQKPNEVVVGLNAYKNIGKCKDDCSLDPLLMYVGLRPRLYFIRDDDEDEVIPDLIASDEEDDDEIQSKQIYLGTTDDIYPWSTAEVSTNPTPAHEKLSKNDLF